MDAEEMIAMMEGETRVEEVRSAAQPASGVMTLRERYRRAMFFQKLDQLPNFEFGYWAETLTEWHQQGLPASVSDEKSAYRYFGIENWKNAPVNTMGLIPAFEYKVLKEDDKYITYRDAAGFTAQINKVGHKSIPHYIDFPIKDRADWESFRERLKPDASSAPATGTEFASGGPSAYAATVSRVPSNWNELAAEYNRRDYPLGISIGSMIGIPRNWIGFENICYMVHDEPELLEEIVEHLCCLTCDTLSRVLPDVEFDFASGWEDICFNSGPIVGVDFMRDVVTPRYKRITNLLRKHGCQIAWTDCDGDIKPIVDCFLNGGINCMFPVEVHGGSDPVELRRRHPDLRMQGGFCKMVLAKDRTAILAEMQRLLPLVKDGGFIPGVDHRVQADVPYKNYLYYLKLKREMFGVGGTPEYDESKV